MEIPAIIMLTHKAIPFIHLPTFVKGHNKKIRMTHKVKHRMIITQIIPLHRSRLHIEKNTVSVSAWKNTVPLT